MSEQDLSNPLYFILDQLKGLSARFDTIQRDLTAIQGSLVSRGDLKDLRDLVDREFKAERERCDGEFETERKERVRDVKELSDKVGLLQIKAGIASVIIAAIVAWAVRKLGG